MYSLDEAKALLKAAGVFHDDEDVDAGLCAPYTIMLNDTWAWACADCETVPEAELPRLAELFFRYGHGGVLYWVSEKRGGERSAFCDINRSIDYARQEEAIRADVPGDSKRAYARRSYTIGEAP